MKIYAKPYKTYESARKRILFEKAHPMRGRQAADFVWNVLPSPPGAPKGWHVVRYPRAEYDRIRAIDQALAALGVAP